MEKANTLILPRTPWLNMTSKYTDSAMHTMTKHDTDSAAMKNENSLNEL